MGKDGLLHTNLWVHRLLFYDLSRYYLYTVLPIVFFIRLGNKTLL